MNSKTRSQRCSWTNDEANNGTVMGLMLCVFNVVRVVVEPSGDGEGLDLVEDAVVRSGWQVLLALMVLSLR